MKAYQVWYQKKPTFLMDGKTDGITLANLEKTNVYLTGVVAEDREDAFTKMQGENWSPNGEARPLIDAKGLMHTSMSVGDVLIDGDDFSGYLCLNTGWQIIK